MTPDERLEKSRWANVEGKRLHFKNDSGMGGSGGDSLQLGTRSDSANEFLNSWQSQLKDAGALDPWVDHPEHPWAGGATTSGQSPDTWDSVAEMRDANPAELDSELSQYVRAPNSGGALQQVDARWDEFRTKHPFIANLAQGAVATLFATFAGLPGALAAKYIFYRLNRENSAQPSTPNPAPSPNP